jgi:hypothetical protein
MDTVEADQEENKQMRAPRTASFEPKTSESDAANYAQVIRGAQGVADKIVGNQPKESTYSQSGGPWNWLFPRTKQAVKNVLPDLSELPAAATNTDNRDNRNLGPNEVGKDLLGGLPNASKTDTAAPGATRLSHPATCGFLHMYQCLGFALLWGSRRVVPA